ncbi:MAG TPA: hypothetical protein VHY75_11710 [Steroidobacteraceae bacterium]|nr:hypothetical protein [Steroidobacteraceae bacterium]
MRLALLLALIAWAGTVAWNAIKPLPAGTHVASLSTRLLESQLEVIEDTGGARNILARELALIDRADQMIVLDQAPLLRETGQHLLLRKRERPNVRIVVLADPLPEVYGGTPAHYLDSLERAGIVVVRTRLDRLRDPLPWYTALWRVGIGWWSDPYDETAPRAGFLASLRRANFKADRRQLLVADDGAGSWIGMLPAVAGGQLAVAVAGGAARDMASSELKIAAWSAEDDRLPGAPPPAGLAVGSIDARFLTEGAIRGALVDAFAAAGSGDEIGLSTPLLSDRAVVEAALHAAGRGARIRLLLDREAAPNRAVAEELEHAGGESVEVRWLPAGQARSSLAIVRHHRELWVSVGAVDFSRLTLDDLDLSSALELRLQANAPAARRFNDAFEAQWSGSAADPPSADSIAPGYWRYRALQSAGLAAY